MGNDTELLKLATEKFSKLSDAEVKFFTATAKGDYADYSSGDEKVDEPENADGWGDERVLRANVIEWLCSDREASQFITHNGIVVGGVRVDGGLNLRFAKIDFPFVFLESVFRNDIILQYSKLKYLNLGGTYTKSISADGLEVEGPVYLRNGFRAEGEVRLLGAEIEGDFSCINGKFINPKGKALNADGLKVKGDVFLGDGFKAEGEVRLLGAEIGGTLDCSKSEFIKPKADALSTCNSKVKDDVFALSACNSKVKGNVFLRDGFKAEGEVNLIGAEIGGNFECDKSEFINPEENALNANGLRVKGSVFLRDGFKAEGEVNLLGAEIGGNLDCNKSEFINPKAKSLNADGLKVKRCVFLRGGFKAEGKIVFVGAIINGYFIYTGVKSPEGAELDLRSARIGVLFDEEESWPKEGNLYLHGAVYEEIYQGSPRDAKRRIKWLRLNGGGDFSPQPYEQLASVLQKSGHEKDAKEVLIAKNKDRIKLSKTQWWYKFFGPMIGYGYKPLHVFWKGPMGIWFLGSILFWLILGSSLFCWGYYGEKRIMSPSKTDVYAESAEDVSKTKAIMHDEYPTFQFIVYSIDAFVPVVDLHQSKYWLPNANKGKVLCETKWFEIRSGGLFLVYLWVHIAFGWILTTLFVVGLTGLVRK